MSTRTTTSGKPRQRSAVACNPCRTKKIRCDGIRPSCTSCRDANQECVYTNRECNGKPPSKRYVEALKERIKNLEEQLRQCGSSVSTSTSWDVDTLNGEVPASDVDSDDGSNSMEERSPVRELTDRPGRLNVGEGGQMRYFGSRSNFSLLRGEFLDQKSTSAAALKERGMRTVEQLGIHLELPRDLQDHLLDLYWRWQNPWQYIVMKEVFLRDLYVDHSGRYCSPLLLSAILALASRYSDRPEVRTDPDDPSTAGDALAEQAKMLLLFETEAPMVTTIQAAALLSLRETATDKESLGWVYSGMATRMAFNLGLHLDCTRWLKAGYITEEAAEVRKITWWGCYVLDKLFNVGLGRPCTIQENEVTAPLPTELDDPEFGPWSPASETSSTAKDFDNGRIITNCRMTCKLLQITSAALDEIYRPKRPKTRMLALDLVCKTQTDLLEFYTQLPSCLRLPTTMTHPTVPHVYQLHLQYHVAVILLHRPFIGARYNAKTGSLHGEGISTHMRYCINAAMSIANIFKAYREHYTLRKIPISAVHCAFTASIILLFDTTSPESTSRRNSIRLLELLALALHEMSIAWTWSRRAIRALQQLGREWSVGKEVHIALHEGVSHEDEQEASTSEFLQSTTALDDNSHFWLHELEGFDQNSYSFLWQDMPYYEDTLFDGESFMQR